MRRIPDTMYLFPDSGAYNLGQLVSFTCSNPTSPRTPASFRTPCTSFRTATLTIQDNLYPLPAAILFLHAPPPHFGHHVPLSGQQRLQFRTPCPLYPPQHPFFTHPASFRTPCTSFRTATLTIQDNLSSLAADPTFFCAKHTGPRVYVDK